MTKKELEQIPEQYRKYLLTPKKGKAPKHPRLPNGFGSIVTLSGNRRRPYMARPAVKEFDENGHPVYEKPLGYFEEWVPAFLALVKYNENPYDTTARNMTYAQVYEAWYKEKFEINKKKIYSKSTIDCAKAAFKNSAELHQKQYHQLRTPDFQKVLDDCPLKHASIELIQNLFKQLGKYALKYDIVEKDYAALTTINQEDDDIGGVPFTTEDMKVLWANKDKPFVDTILILVYSGFRIGAMNKLSVNLNDVYFQGGIKTRSSKNRIVPIHSSIQELVRGRILATEGFWPWSPTVYRSKFLKCLQSLGIATAHTPHDCRHTFASLLSSSKADPLVIKLLMGHSLGGDITEEKYIHKTIFDLKTEIEKIEICL